MRGGQKAGVLGAWFFVVMRGPVIQGCAGSGLIPVGQAGRKPKQSER